MGWEVVLWDCCDPSWIWEQLDPGSAAQVAAPSQAQNAGSLQQTGILLFFDAFYKLNKILPGLLRKGGMGEGCLRMETSILPLHPSSFSPILSLLCAR